MAMTVEVRLAHRRLLSMFLLGAVPLLVAVNLETSKTAAELPQAIGIRRWADGSYFEPCRPILRRLDA